MILVSTDMGKFIKAPEATRMGNMYTAGDGQREGHVPSRSSWMSKGKVDMAVVLKAVSWDQGCWRLPGRMFGRILRKIRRVDTAVAAYKALPSAKSARALILAASLI